MQKWSNSRYCKCWKLKRAPWNPIKDTLWGQTGLKGLQECAVQNTYYMRKLALVILPLPVLCSTMGAVAKGTDFRSKGFSEGSRVYWCSALSRPGIDTVNPGEETATKIMSTRNQGALCWLINQGTINSPHLLQMASSKHYLKRLDTSQLNPHSLYKLQMRLWTTTHCESLYPDAKKPICSVATHPFLMNTCISGKKYIWQ